MLEWGSAEWEALGTVILGVGAIVAGVWSLFNYRKSRRAEAARWLQGVFRDFYLDNRFERVRHVLEYSFDDTAGPLLERRITDRHVQITDADLRLLKELDDLLNYFEYILYLEEQKHIKYSDRQAVFQYWFEIMSAGERASLRRYASFFGFERVAGALSSADADYIALYGSLMSTTRADDAPDFSDMLRLVGPCSIPGVLHDLGSYPGLKRGGPSDTVVGELYRVLDHRLFRLLDEFERYDPERPGSSLYVRRLLRLVDPDQDAWVYLFNGPTNDAPLVVGGDWVKHLTARGAADPRGAGG